MRSGFHSTSMQAICTEAGISAGGLYLYFDSKEALIEGIAEGERERVLADFGHMRAAPDFLAALESCIDNCVLQQSAAKTALFLEVVAEAMRNPAVRSTLRRVDEAIRSAMRDLFSRAQRDGAISPHVVVDDLVNAMAVTIDGLLLRRAIDPAFEPRHVGTQLMHTVRNMALGNLSPGGLATGDPLVPNPRPNLDKMLLETTK